MEILDGIYRAAGNPTCTIIDDGRPPVSVRELMAKIFKGTPDEQVHASVRYRFDGDKKIHSCLRSDLTEDFIRRGYQRDETDSEANA